MRWNKRIETKSEELLIKIREYLYKGISVINLNSDIKAGIAGANVCEGLNLGIF
jgi:hypothetical protein